MNTTALPVISQTIANSDLGINRQINTPGPDARTASVFAATALMNSPKLGKAAAAFDSFFSAQVTDLIEKNESGLHGKMFDDAKALFLTKMKPALASFIKTVRNENGEHAARLVRTLDWRRDAEPNPALRQDLRHWLMGHDLPRRIVLLMDADYSLVCSVIEIGQAATGLDDSQWEVFLNHARAVIHIHKAGTAADFPRKPTVEKPLATGIDHDAVMANAKALLDQLRADGEILDLAESYIKAVVRVIAMLTNERAETVIGIE